MCSPRLRLSCIFSLIVESSGVHEGVVAALCLPAGRHPVVAASHGSAPSALQKRRALLGDITIVSLIAQTLRRPRALTYPGAVRLRQPCHAFPPPATTATFPREVLGKVRSISHTHSFHRHQYPPHVVHLLRSVSLPPTLTRSCHPESMVDIGVTLDAVHSLGMDRCTKTRIPCYGVTRSSFSA